MKRLYLTGIKRVLNEEAQKRFDSFEYNEPTDSEGRTADWYENLNLPIPKDLQQPNQIQILSEEDYDEYEVDVIVKLKDFTMAVDEEDYGCTIYLRSGQSRFVIEDTEAINTQIWWYNRSFWEKLKEKINKWKKKYLKK